MKILLVFLAVCSIPFLFAQSQHPSVMQYYTPTHSMSADAMPNDFSEEVESGEAPINLTVGHPLKVNMSRIHHDLGLSLAEINRLFSGKVFVLQMPLVQEPLIAKDAA